MATDALVPVLGHARHVPYDARPDRRPQHLKIYHHGRLIDTAECPSIRSAWRYVCYAIADAADGRKMARLKRTGRVRFGKYRIVWL